MTTIPPPCLLPIDFSPFWPPPGHPLSIHRSGRRPQRWQPPLPRLSARAWPLALCSRRARYRPPLETARGRLLSVFRPHPGHKVAHRLAGHGWGGLHSVVRAHGWYGGNVGAREGGPLVWRERGEGGGGVPTAKVKRLNR